jgi:hypothetical protein
MRWLTLQSCQQYLNSPCGIRDASLHCRSAADGFVDFDEVVICVVQSHSGLEVFQLFAESVGQSGQAAAVHSQCVILFFNVACGDQFNVWLPLNNCPFYFHEFGRRISALLLKLRMAKGFDN